MLDCHVLGFQNLQHYGRILFTDQICLVHSSMVNLMFIHILPRMVVDIFNSNEQFIEHVFIVLPVTLHV